jgi:hypothetical protein
MPSMDWTPDLSSMNSTHRHAVDADHQPTDLAVGGSNRSRTDSSLHRVGQRLLLVSRVTDSLHVRGGEPPGQGTKNRPENINESTIRDTRSRETSPGPPERSKIE